MSPKPHPSFSTPNIAISWSPSYTFSLNPNTNPRNIPPLGLDSISKGNPKLHTYDTVTAAAC